VIWASCLTYCFMQLPTHEGFTKMVANEGMHGEDRAYLNQVPGIDGLNVPSEGHGGNPSTQFLG